MKCDTTVSDLIAVRIGVDRCSAFWSLEGDQGGRIEGCRFVHGRVEWEGSGQLGETREDASEVDSGGFGCGIAGRVWRILSSADYDDFDVDDTDRGLCVYREPDDEFGERVRGGAFGADCDDRVAGDAGWGGGSFERGICRGESAKHVCVCGRAGRYCVLRDWVGWIADAGDWKQFVEHRRLCFAGYFA